MARNTRSNTAASRKNAPPDKPTPRKTRKRANSATDTERERKKTKTTKPTLVVEPVKKGGRKAKVAKDKAQKGNKRGKNRCVTTPRIFFSSDPLSID